MSEEDLLARRLANDLKLRIYGLVRVQSTGHDSSSLTSGASQRPRPETLAERFGRYRRLATRMSKGLFAYLRTVMVRTR
jgi:hypothetical protein